MDPITAAATIAGAAITADAMKSAPTSSTTTTAPPSYIAGEYQALADRIGDLRSRGLFEDIQTMSPYERALVEQGMTRAAAGDPFQAAGERAVEGLLGQSGVLGEAADIYRGVAGGPDTMSTPAFQAAAQRQVDMALRPLTSSFARGGRLGSGLMGAAAGEAAAEALSPLMYQAQQADIANRMSAAQGLTGISGEEARRLGAGLTGAATVSDMPFTNIQRGLGLSGLLSGEEYAIRQRDVTGAQRLADMLRGSTVGSQTTQPLYSAPSGSIFGGALMAAAPQIGQAFSNFGGGTAGGSSMGSFQTGGTSYAPTVNYTPFSLDYSGLGGN